MKTQINIPPRKALSMYQARKPIRLYEARLEGIGTIKGFGIASNPAALREAVKEYHGKHRTRVRSRPITSEATFTKPIKRDDAVRGALSSLKKVRVF